MARKLSKNARIGIGVAAAGLAFLGIGVAAASAAGPRPTPGGGDGDGYSGPGPNMPGGGVPPGGKPPAGSGQPPTGPSFDRPQSIAPTDLWIAPDCSDVMVGPDWLAETARPAIEAWAADGVPAEDPSGGMSFDPELSPERVVREIIGPYGPLCMDVWPWRDIEMTQNPPPDPGAFADTDLGYLEYLGAFEEWDAAFADKQQAALEANRGYGELVAMVYAAVRDVYVGGAAES